MIYNDLNNMLLFLRANSLSLEDADDAISEGSSCALPAEVPDGF